MAYLEEIPSYKDDLLHAFIENENIITLIGSKDQNIQDPVDLIGENIFPNPYVPDIQSEVKTYLCMDIYVPRVNIFLIKICLHTKGKAVLIYSTLKLIKY